MNRKFDGHERNMKEGKVNGADDFLNVILHAFLFCVFRPVPSDFNACAICLPLTSNKDALI